MNYEHDILKHKKTSSKKFEEVFLKNSKCREPPPRKPGVSFPISREGFVFGTTPDERHNF